MKKEVILAISLGSILGAFLAFGFYKANRAVVNKAQKAPKELSKEGKNHLLKQIEENLPRDIENPLNNQVLNSKTATISGKTNKNTPVTIITEEEEYIVLTDEAGRFSQVIPLIKGINEITITSINNFKDTSIKNLNLYYTTEEVEKQED